MHIRLLSRCRLRAVEVVIRRGVDDLGDGDDFLLVGVHSVDTARSLLLILPPCQGAVHTHAQSHNHDHRPEDVDRLFVLFARIGPYLWSRVTKYLSMATVDEVFAALREFPTLSERGTAFEKLMVRFLPEDKTFADRFENVSRWDQWEFNGGHADTGIDLVAKEKLMGRGQRFSVSFTSRRQH